MERRSVWRLATGPECSGFCKQALCQRASTHPLTTRPVARECRDFANPLILRRGNKRGRCYLHHHSRTAERSRKSNRPARVAFLEKPCKCILIHCYPAGRRGNASEKRLRQPPGRRNHPSRTSSALRLRQTAVMLKVLVQMVRGVKVVRMVVGRKRARTWRIC